MYRVETTACHEKPTRAEATVDGPSRTRESANSGTGTTIADQTVSERPPETPEAREMTLPMPQDSAPSTHRVRAATVTCPPRPTATTTSPAEPSTTPTTCGRVGRSRSTAAAMAIVKITWACSTRAARPGGRPASMATYSSPNWPRDMKTSDRGDGAPGCRRAGDEEHGGQHDEGEPDGGEQQRRDVVHAPVDDHEVEAPHRRHERGQQRVASVHGPSLTPGSRKHQRMIMRVSM